MNFLDIILIIVNIVVILGGLGVMIFIVKESYDWSATILTALSLALLVLGIIGITLLFTITPFIVIDKGEGSTIGTITSVDKNFFGTTAVYIKTSETEQEKYCIEDEEIAEQVKGLIGKEVKVSYGERIGLYSTGKCSQAPIDKVEVVEDE